MKKIFFSIAALSLFTAVQAQKLDRSIRPKPGIAPEIKLGDAETFTLDNGLKVFVVENHKLPAVTYSIILDIHPESEGNKSGMHDMVGELITSGTQGRSKDKFDEETDMISANIGASNESIYGRSLTKYQDQMLDLMSDALLNANFQQKELENLKKRALSGLDVSKTDPDDMLHNVSSVVNYGTNHPYGQVTTEETINNITLADCNGYYKKYFRPNVAYMAIVGDINLAKAKEMAEKYFSKWQKGEVPRSEYPSVTAPAKTQVDFVPRDGAVQSTVSITYPVDLMIGTPDVIKTRVMNQVLGGSFQRLDHNLRETHAWTYGSNSSISSDDIVGNVDVNVQCRNEVTDSSIVEMMKEMETMRSTPLTQDELQGAVNFISGVFALGLENPQTIAQYAINIERYKMPKDYYKNYLKNVSATTTGDIQTTAQKYLKPGNAHIVVVGNKSEIPKLKKFGEVKFYDNYGNPTTVTESKVIDGVGIDQVLDKYINAIGGKAAIEGLKDLSVVSAVNDGGREYTQSVVVLSPGRIKQTMSVDGQVMQKAVINGESGYVEGGGQRQNLPAEAIKEFKPDADLQMLLHPTQLGVSFTLLGKEMVDGKEAYSVERIENDGHKKTVQSYDAATGLLFKEVVSTNEGVKSKVEIKVLSDYREVKNGNGFKIPFETKSLTGGGEKVATAKANSGVKESEFK
ncbi:M16 family metallopeptidase [Taibaiella koreensis]|uniref:M16 family metallopeptidase n=1 Tax=Taibaiella koreensis TaxID=1268548 RepID=UPI0013C3125E|nr:pitrilysin family protein [Taibaiella koreensis]